MAKGKLKDDVKTFIVQSLACFDTPSIVVEAVRKEFGKTITRQSVEGYDPTKKAGTNLAEKWKLLFEETRKTFLEDTATIAISHRAVRLRALQRMAEKAETQGNMVLAASLMKQAAEEVGNAYTNRRELTGKDGKDLPVPVSPVTIFQLPDNGRS
ncbi:hypothetical protein FB009_109178 [Sinorhizobium medicae]|uniref:DUF2280 domain-containing protein n=1 Tax=Sinorhizobium medicae TaxID=110321 RepID=UPI00119C0B6E|nr:DUF2280 domain-containing protein [Sinorhizobium medicae]MQU78405.1 DUF2280 domain-containing protein [Sinorhizobium medicae]TWA37341.1 hypothetical protein FB009_109178 [Sinorhizobium medicae]